MSPIKYLRQAEICALFSVITDVRDRALFATIYRYGLRVSEAALINLEYVNFCHQTLFIKRVKKGIDGEYRLFSDMVTLIKRYLLIRLDTSDALFTGRQGRLSPRRIQQLFRRYAQQAGLDRKYTVHSLRHSAGTHLHEAGLDIADVQAHLGHVCIENTRIYAHITDKRRLAAFQVIEHSPVIVKFW